MSTLLEQAVQDPAVRARFLNKLRYVPGTDCVFYTGAISGRGHARFYLGSQDGRGVTVIAHRFAYALERGVEELQSIAVLGHRCDNPLCQKVDPEHVWRSTASQNRLIPIEGVDGA